MAALFINTSTCPNSPRAVLVIFSMLSSLDKSACTETTFDPNPLIVSETLSSASLVRPVATTLAPSLANAIVVARPIPMVAPDF